MNNFIDANALRAEVDLVELLRKLGHQPVGKSKGQLKYHSPVRTGDSTPSFLVNPETGEWYDFGLPGGGDLLTFAKSYWPLLSFYQRLQKIREVYELPMHKLQYAEPREREPRPRRAERVPSFELIAVKALGNNPILEEFLKGRCVWEAAQGLLSEVYYRMKADEHRPARNCFGVGWLNEFREWEVRTAAGWKSFLGANKGLSVFPGSPAHLVVFEGIMDYLSWLALHPDQQPTAMVLNGAGLIELAIKAASGYEFKSCFFDQDDTGREITARFLKVYPEAVDGAAAYVGFNDFNEMHMAQPKPQLPWQSPDVYRDATEGFRR